VCPAAIIRISEGETAFWLFAGYRTDIQRFNAGRIVPGLAAECMLLCGYDLPADLTEWAALAHDPEGVDRNASAHSTAQIEQVQNSPEPIPSLDVLVELHQALWGFSNLTHSTITPTSAQENEVLPRFIRLADALRPVRRVVDKIGGWPTKIGRALRLIVKTFDAIAQRWGWEEIVSPDPARSAFLEDRHTWVRENLERPLYEAALAVSSGWDESTPCPYDDLADEARRRGIVTAMTPQEGLARFGPARSRLNSEPHMGKCYPRIGEQEAADLVTAFNDLHPFMTEIAPDRCTRPPWQEQAAARPIPRLGLTHAKAPHQTQSPPSTVAQPSTDVTVSDVAGTPIPVRDRVFISYSHKDERFRDELQTHLRPYLRKGTIAAWSDVQIEPGSKWFDEIKAALTKTAIAVMLVSPDFLASDFIHEHELGPLLREAEAGGVEIHWVLIRDCSWRESPLKNHQSVLPPEKPLAGMPKAKRDTAWRRV
jgi:hypothetical protein